jgi:hypothetical protein
MPLQEEPMEPHPTLTATRRALHGVAELVLAGPQHASVDTVRLRVTPGGFATSAADPPCRLLGPDVQRGPRTASVNGSTPRALAAALGLVARTLGHVYSDGSGVGLDEVLRIDDDAVHSLTEAWSAGDDALRRLDPDQQPVLWPEHFDVGISLDQVNYGVSPGRRHQSVALRLRRSLDAARIRRVLEPAVRGGPPPDRPARRRRRACLLRGGPTPPREMTSLIPHRRA